MKLILKTEALSVNSMYRGRRFLTKEAKGMKESMAWEMKSQMKGKILEGDVAVNIIFYLKNNRNDLDNLLKGFLDCMTGIIYVDDRQIKEIHCFKEIDKKNPRIELLIL